MARGRRFGRSKFKSSWGNGPVDVGNGGHTPNWLPIAPDPPKPGGGTYPPQPHSGVWAGGKGMVTVSRGDYDIYSHGQYCINFGGGGAIYDCECPEHMNTCTCRSTNNDCDCASGNNCGAVR